MHSKTVKKSKSTKLPDYKSNRVLPVVVDTTLRDGVQMPGVHLSDADKYSIVDKLSLLGIREVELGCAARKESEGTFFRKITELHQEICFSLWCRARRDDIASAKMTGIRSIHISFPVSACHMRVLGVTPSQVIAKMLTLTSEAKDGGYRVTIGAQDATRAELPFLLEFIQAASSAGTERIRIADTVGIGTPESINTLFESIHENCQGAATEFHGHDDFGLAVANAFAAARAGCNAVSVTVNGVGERAGNVALEEFVTGGTMLYHLKSSLELPVLADLCSCVGKAFGLETMKSKAISGLNAFRHESGIHCHGQMRDSTAYQPFNPKIIGRRTQFSIGEQSGISTVQAVFAEQGQRVDKREARKILQSAHTPQPEV